MCCDSRLILCVNAQGPNLVTSLDDDIQSTERAERDNLAQVRPCSGNCNLDIDKREGEEVDLGYRLRLLCLFTQTWDNPATPGTCCRAQQPLISRQPWLRSSLKRSGSEP